MSPLYHNIISLLNSHHIPFQEFDHAPIITYEDAQKQAKIHGFHGTESKNVFIKDQNGNFYVYLTIAGQKVDFPKLKEKLSLKCQTASAAEVESVIRCVPGCVVPFGFDQNNAIIIDPVINNITDYLFSPGLTTKTIQTNFQDLKKIFPHLPNQIIAI